MALRDLLVSECAASPLARAAIAARAGITDALLGEILLGRKGFSLYMAERIMAAVGRELVVGTRSTASVPPVKDG